MQFKKYAVAGLILVAVFVAGRFSSPKEVEIKEVEKVVYKERETTEEDKKTRSTRRETINTDGSRTIEVIRETDKKSRTDSQIETESERVSEGRTVNQSNWSLGLYRGSESFSATLDRRIYGGLFLGVYGRSDLTLNNREFGVGLRIEF